MNFLPSSEDAEEGLLGSFLLSPSEVGRLCAERKVQASHFHFPRSATIYPHLLTMWGEGKPIDIILLTQRLRDRGELDGAGGPGYVTELFTSLPTAANAPHYLEILEEKRLLRQIIGICSEYGQRSRSEQHDMPNLLTEVQAAIAGLGTDTSIRVPTMEENIAEAIDVLNGRVGGDGSAVIKCGLAAFDTDLGPVERGNLLVIGGQTKAGKSMLAGQLALNIAMSGLQVVYISLEMTERELTLRLLSILARVDVRRVREWNEHEHARFAVARNTLATVPFTIITRRSQLCEVTAICQQYAARGNLGCVVLDYAQLCEGLRNARDDRRQQELATISRTCKRLASTLNILFILLTQLNDDGRTRESRDIENDANILVEVGHNKDSGERGVKVVLARSAPSGQRLKLRIIPEHTRVEDAPEMNIEPEEKPTRRPKRNWHQE